MTDKLREAAQQLPPFDDIRVQAAYKILTDDEMPEDKSEHWEGYQARRIVAALAQQDAQAVQQWWKLTPVEPTPEMRKAAADAWIDCGDRLILNKAAAALRAGIAAAPTPPAQQMLTDDEID